jgi:3-hydroxyisobutyrate dehydrogenase-like beta-hydroxyacid dehydrogenase
VASFAASRVLEGTASACDGSVHAGIPHPPLPEGSGIANEAAAAHSVAIPATALVTQLVNALVAAGGGDLDYAAIGTVLMQLSRADEEQKQT